MKDSEERLNKIESKYLFQEDSLEKLSKELRTQQIEIQRLNGQIVSLKESIKEISSNEKFSEEKPPHY